MSYRVLNHPRQNVRQTTSAMQDRYVGDIGDFGKYALLRRICGSTSKSRALSLGIVWCLFPDENHNSDGRHVTYLSRGELRPLDPELFDRLKELVASQSRRVSAVAASGLFPVTTVFFDAPTCIRLINGKAPGPHERVRYRAQWLNDCIAATANCEMVFLDPDNGLQTKSVGKRDLKAGKYVFWDEISAFVERGQALVVYHHTNRTEPVPAQVARLKQEFASKLPGREVIPLVFRRGSCRVFWIVLEGAATPLLNERVHGMMQTDWKLHFEMM